MNKFIKYQTLLGLVIFCGMAIVSEAAVKPRMPLNIAPEEVLITNIKDMSRKPVVAGSRVVLLLKGKSLNLISEVSIKQKGRSVGKASIEKYSSKSKTERRVILNISTKAKVGLLNLELKVGNKKMTLPKTFKLSVTKPKPRKPVQQTIRVKPVVGTGSYQITPQTK